MCRLTKSSPFWLFVIPQRSPSCHSLRSMLPAASSFPRKWARTCAEYFHNALSFVVFLFLDLLETVLCVVYRYLDEFFEGKSPRCYCEHREQEGNEGGVEENEVSETLYGRKNLFRQMKFPGFARKRKESEKIGSHERVNRWSDCGCESCISWMKTDEQKLHVVVKEPSQGNFKLLC